MSLAITICVWWMTLIPHLLGHMVIISPQVCKWVKFYIWLTCILASGIICKWVKFYIFKCASESNFTFSSYLTNWSHMTFDLHLWPLTSWICEGSHIVSMKKFGYNLISLTFEPILQLDLWWALVLRVYELWSHEHTKDLIMYQFNKVWFFNFFKPIS